MKRNVTLVELLIGFGVVATMGSICGAPSHFDRDSYQVKIVGTERVNNSQSSKYLVFAKDEQTGRERVFENTDSSLECVFDRCKFDSSDIQARAKKYEKTGEPVTVQTYGWRVPFFSWYENVTAIQPMKKE